MRYESFSIGNGQTLVSFENGQMDVVNEEQLIELKSKTDNNLEQVDMPSNKVYFNELLNRMLSEYTFWRENEFSKVDERVTVKIMKERLKWSKDEVDYIGEYEIIGDESQETLSTQMIKVIGMVPAWKNINVIYRSLLQLWFSGCHATAEDEMKFKEAMSRRH